MQHAYAPPAPVKQFRVDTPNFYIRLLTPDDATDRWAVWFEAPEVREAINLPEAKRTKADMAAYIQSFDQRMRIICGVFDKANDLLVCMASCYVDWARSDYLINVIIGEAGYRNRGVMTELTPPFRDYFFDALDLQASSATALATNKVVRQFLLNTGWTEVYVEKSAVRRHSDGAFIDLHHYKLTREAWRAWKAANLVEGS